MIDGLLNILNLKTIEEFIWATFSFSCHQDKTYLFKIYEEYLPLCSRCTGLHSGFFITVIALLFINRKIQLTLSIAPKFILILLITLSGIHWLGGRIELFNSNLYTRILTGLVSGSSFGFLAITYKNIEDKYYNPLRKTAIVNFLLILILISVTLSINESKYLSMVLGFVAFFNTLVLLVSLFSIFRITDKTFQQIIKQEVLSCKKKLD
jgi:uncharacterized membrane protein